MNMYEQRRPSVVDEDRDDNPEIIHRYTRGQALADGVLVAVPTELARQAGFTVPVALTAAAWADCVTWTSDDDARKPEFTGQDETGRLWDVLTMARRAARAQPQHNAFAERLLEQRLGSADDPVQSARRFDSLGPAPHQHCLVQLLLAQLDRADLLGQPRCELVLITPGELTEPERLADLRPVVLDRAP